MIWLVLWSIWTSICKNITLEGLCHLRITLVQDCQREHGIRQSIRGGIPTQLNWSRLVCEGVCLCCGSSGHFISWPIIKQSGSAICMFHKVSSSPIHTPLILLITFSHWYFSQVCSCRQWIKG